MKRLIFVLLFACASKAAAYEFTYEKAYSSATATGVNCTTGTSVQVDGAGSNMTALSGMTTAGYRFQNQHASCALWIGYGAAVSSSALSNLGVKLTAGKDGSFPVGYDADRKAMVPVRCLAEDACGANGANMSREVFGIK